MSDQQPHEAGSPRSRREIREARERELAEQRERQTAAQQRALDETLRNARRQSSATSARQLPLPNIAPVQESVIFNQEEVTQGKLEREDPPVEPPAAQTSPPATPAQPTSFDRVVTPFDQVVSPDEVDQETEQAVDESTGYPLEDDPEGHYVDEHYVEGHHDDQHYDENEHFDENGELHYEGTRIHHDDDGTPLLISSSSHGRGYQTVSAVDGGTTQAVLQRRRDKRRRRNLTLSVAFGLFAVLVVGFVVVLQSLLGGDGPQDFETQAGENVEFTVEPGDGPIAVRGRLLEQGIIASADAFDDAYEQLEGTREVFEGEFPMREQMPAEDAVAILFDEEEAVDFIDLRAGMRIDAALSAIATGTGIPESDIRQAASDPTAYGLPEEATSLEGYLASGLYNPEVGADPEDILQQMVDGTFERLEEAGVTEEGEQWETIIIASLLTAEGLPGDYEMIAGIIENRLDPSNDETGGLLQIDAAVIYGLGTQSVQFTDEERQDASNPYNTYQNEGLPPGPIAAPSEETIEAAGNPEPSDNYYWITTNLETGETKFAETYEQHREYVQEFNAYCEENPEICEGEPAQDNQGP